MLIFQSRTTSGRLDAPIIAREVLRRHGHHGRKTPSKHLVPMGFPYGLAVVRTQHGFGRPFLLVEGPGSVGRWTNPGEIIEVIFRPGLANFLDGECQHAR